MNKTDKVYARKLWVRMNFWCSQRNEQLELDVLVGSQDSRERESLQVTVFE